MKTHTITAALVAAFALCTVSTVRAADATPEKDAPKKETPAKKDAVKPYKLDTCVVSGDKLAESKHPVSFDYKGQEIKLCCKDCRKDFDKDPEKYLKMMNGK